jgi:hypothetical protein
VRGLPKACPPLVLFDAIAPASASKRGMNCGNSAIFKLA